MNANKSIETSTVLVSETIAIRADTKVIPAAASKEVIKSIRLDASYIITPKDFDRFFSRPPTKDGMELFVSMVSDDLGVIPPSLEIRKIESQGEKYKTLCRFVPGNNAFLIIVNGETLYRTSAFQLYMSLAHEVRHLSQYLLVSLLDTENEELQTKFMSRLGILSIEDCRQMKREFTDYKSTANASYAAYHSQLIELDANVYSRNFIIRLFINAGLNRDE